MNVQPPSPHERLYELIEALRPDFDEQGEVDHLAAEPAQRLKRDAPSSDEQARRLRGGDTGKGDGLDAARKELTELLEKHPNLIDSRLIDTWHEIARVDDLLGEAVQDVAVPEYLQQQILSAVHAHKSSVRAKASLYKRRANRLWMVAIVASLAVLIAVFSIKWFMVDSFSGLQKEQLLTSASSCFAEGASPLAKSLSGPLSEKEQKMLDHFVPSEDVLSPNAATWESVSEIFDSPAVVYRFEDQHGNRAALFVVCQSRPVAGLIDRPPRRPQLTTAGRSVGAWQSDGLLYVLVSSGDKNAWRSLLVPQRPVT